MSELISVVVPCYNEESALPFFYEAIDEEAKKLKDQYDLDLEVIFVNDGSKDKTLELIREYSQKDDRVKYVSFSRNFGKESAIYAGLKKAKGDYVAMMDADLQDPPELLGEMYESVHSGEYDCSATRRVNREGEPPVRSWFAHRFYNLMNKISDVDMVDGARDYRLMSRQMTDAVLSMSEYNRFSKGIFGWVGFDTKWIDFENRERVAGETKWSFWKLLKYSLDGIVGFSVSPLSLASVLGLIMFLVSIIWIIVIIVKTLVWGDPVAGYPSMICVILFIGGIQLLCIGVLGEYLSKTYLETKNRPIFIVKEESIEKDEVRDGSEEEKSNH